MPWTERYRPQTVSEVVGNLKAKGGALKWAQATKITQPLLIVGPVGIGKTALAKALCNDMRWVAVDCQALPGELLPMVEQVLFRKHPLNLALILDEVDTWHGNERTELVKLLKHPKRNAMPIVCIAEDVGKNMDTLKRLCVVVKMTRLPMDTRDSFQALVRRLRTVSQKTWTPRLLQQVERMCCNDFRRAVLTLELGAQDGGKVCGGSGDLFVDSVFDATECILSAHPKQLEAEDSAQMFHQHDLMLYMLHDNALRRHDLFELSSWFSDMDVLDSHSAHATHAYPGAMSAHLFRSLEPPFLRMPRLEFPAALGTMSRRKGMRHILEEHRLGYADWFLLAPLARAEVAPSAKGLGQVPVFFQHLCTAQKYAAKDFRKTVLEHGALPDLFGHGTA